MIGLLPYCFGHRLFGSSGAGTQGDTRGQLRTDWVFGVWFVENVWWRWGERCADGRRS